MSLSPEKWREEGRYTHLLGYEVFYADNGELDKPAVLLLHGFPTSSWDWGALWDDLGSRYRLVAPDLLGFGYTDKPDPHEYTIMEQADLCEALVRQLGLTEFHVLAHDYGDTVAQELLARQNEGTGAGVWRSVCFLNGGLFPETHLARPIQKLLLSPLGPLINRVSSQRTFDRSFSAVFGEHTKPTKQDLDRFWQLILHKNGKLFHRLIAYMTDRKQHRERWLRALTDSIVPISLINGSADPVSGKHMVARYREIVSRDHMVMELPTIGHYPQVEAPAAVLDGYQRFLDTV